MLLINQIQCNKKEQSEIADPRQDLFCVVYFVWQINGRSLIANETSMWSSLIFLKTMSRLLSGLAHRMYNNGSRREEGWEREGNKQSGTET